MHIAVKAALAQAVAQVDKAQLLPCRCSNIANAFPAPILEPTSEQPLQYNTEDWDMGWVKQVDNNTITDNADAAGMTTRTHAS